MQSFTTHTISLKSCAWTETRSTTHGFTENYIRVEVESDDSLDNQVINVRLGEFNEEMTALKGTILI